MGLKKSIQKRWASFLAKLLKGIGRAWTKYPFVEIFSIHLGHTLIESAYWFQHRPILIFWRYPLANRWLVEKLENNLPFPAIQKWLNQIRKKTTKSFLVLNLESLSKNLNNQYYLLNLGFNYLPEKKPQISFTADEIQDAAEFFKANGLHQKKYVCFCIRDETYYKNFKPDLYFLGTESFEFRNANSFNYQMAARYLIKNNIIPVLMGFSTNPAPKEFFRPARSTMYRPWIEAILYQKCLFCVGMMTGGTLYASWFQRPVLWSDVFWRGAPVGSKKDLILPKKILKIENGNLSSEKKAPKEIHMKEWVNLGPPPDNDWTAFSKKGYEPQACSPAEILNAVSDMLKAQSSTKCFLDSKSKRIHQEFSKIHLEKAKKFGVPPTRLAPSWGKKNRNLILSASFSAYEKYWCEEKLGTNLNFKNLVSERKTLEILKLKESKRSTN